MDGASYKLVEHLAGRAATGSRGVTVRFLAVLVEVTKNGSNLLFSTATHCEARLDRMTQSRAGILSAAVSASLKEPPAKLSVRSGCDFDVYNIMACEPSFSRSKGVALTSLPSWCLILRGKNNSTRRSARNKRLRAVDVFSWAATRTSSSISMLSLVKIHTFRRAGRCLSTRRIRHPHHIPFLSHRFHRTYTRPGQRGPCCR